MIITDAWGSVVRFLSDTFPTWTYTDFEDHADLLQIPQEDCVGISGLGAIADDGTDTFAIAIGFSSYNDKNLFRHRAAIAQLYELWRRGGAQIPLYDADTAAMKGSMVVTEGLSLAPMTRADMRPFQIITARMKIVLI